MCVVIKRLYGCFKLIYIRVFSYKHNAYHHADHKRHNDDDTDHERHDEHDADHERHDDDDTDHKRHDEHDGDHERHNDDDTDHERHDDDGRILRRNVGNCRGGRLWNFYDIHRPN